MNGIKGGSKRIKCTLVVVTFAFIEGGDFLLDTRMFSILGNMINGKSIANSEARVFGIGPGLAYNQDNSQDKLWITLNSYFETGAENRPEGIGVALRISLAF